jgi:periplasmic protein CpxP/Spy
MKIKFLSLIVCLFAVAMVASAQGGNFKPRTVEERVQTIHQKMDSTFKLDPAKLTKVDSAFATYYRATDKLRQELMSGGERPDRQVMMEKMAPLTDARDAELKGILTGDQYKKWKDELEPALRPQRRQG